MTIHELVEKIQGSICSADADCDRMGKQCEGILCRTHACVEHGRYVTHSSGLKEWMCADCADAFDNEVPDPIPQPGYRVPEVKS